VKLFTPEYQDQALCIEAMAFAALAGDPISPEIANHVATYAQALKANTPAKEWWHCAATHPAIARALKIDRAQTGGVYALAPFRIYHDGEKHLILAAYPCPRILGPIDMDWLGIEAVLAWNPVDDTATILGDHTPGLFGSDGEGMNDFTLYASPRAFLTDWAINRAHAYVRLTELRKNAWADAEDSDTPPGALAIGDLDKIRLTDLPRDFAAQGFDIANLNKAILKQARPPRAYAHQNRAAA
jgi:hypothetical protein